MKVSRLLAIAVILSTGCKVDPPDDDVPMGDAGPDEGVLATPLVNAPSETPLSTAAFRGSALGASRIVIKETATDQSLVNPLLPGGDFCVDFPVPAGTTSTFLVYAVADDGNISEPAEIEITQSDSATSPADPTCTDGGECAETESCDNGQDDDCNGMMDECDPACNGCEDDYLEPNDTPFSVPQVSEGDYDGLKICPCRIDWYAFDVGAGDSVDVTATFDNAQSDIDLKLQTVENAEAHNSINEAYSTTTNSTETIHFTSTGGGRFYLKIYQHPEGGEGEGTYDLQIN